jgi:hypothetical protein
VFVSDLLSAGWSANEARGVFLLSCVNWRLAVVNSSAYAFYAHRLRVAGFARL